MKKKNDWYDLIIKYVLKIMKIVLLAVLRHVKRTLLNSTKFKKILNTRKKLMIYCISIISSSLIIWMLKWHPLIYILSLFTYFSIYTFVMDIKNLKKRIAIKRLNLRFKSVREMFDNNIDVISVKKDMLTIYSRNLTEKDVSAKHNKLELFFNRKISNIQQQAKNLRYIDIFFLVKTSFKSKYYLEQYIEYVNVSKKMTLPFVLGIDEKENIYIDDFAKLNHFFVSGESDTGKSCLTNCIIQSSMVLNNTIQYVLVDLKEGIELYDYAKFPNCIIIQNLSELDKILEYLASELKRRAEIIKLYPKAKNILQYNKLAKDKMHYIVFLIDEFATIKLGGNNNIENIITDILQKGRACGIYCIGTTQRPSASLMSTDIRAGFLQNISLQIQTKETQKMTKVFGTENLKKGEFKTTMTGNTILKSFFIDETQYNGVFENLEHLLVNQKEFIFIKEKQTKNVNYYKRLCNFIQTKLYKERTIDCTNLEKRIDYRQLIKFPVSSIVREIERIFKLYEFSQNNPHNDSCIQTDNYKAFLDLIFKQNKEGGLLPANKILERKLKISRHERLKLLERAIKEGYVSNGKKTRPRIVPGKWEVKR